VIEHRPFASLSGDERAWLSARHHISFANSQNEASCRWGALRAWNDDEIAPNSGFPPHAHANMEIITYVREGVITHWDSLGNLGQTRAGDVQVMSTGTGIRHAEYNLEHTTARVFQIWIAPDRSGGTPACMRPPSAMKCSSPSPALSSSKADAMAPVPMSDGSRERYTAVAISFSAMGSCCG
jgi:redox-sensitive bicupin YhaK (pirin superfamily)